MLLSLDRRRSLYEARVIAAFTAGTCAGAALTAISLWLLSGLTEGLGRPARLALLAAGAVFVWLAKTGPLAERVSLPEAHRQIPAEVFAGGWIGGGFRFGFELGTGMRTYLPSPAPYVLALALILLRPTLGTALLAALGFGVGRGLPLVVRAVAREDEGFAPLFLSGRDPFAPTAAGMLVLIGALALG